MYLLSNLLEMLFLFVLTNYENIGLKKKKRIIRGTKKLIKKISAWRLVELINDVFTQFTNKLDIFF